MRTTLLSNTFKKFLALLEAFSNYTGEVKYHKDVYRPPVWDSEVSKFLNRLPALRQSVHWKEERSWKHNYKITNRDLNPSDTFELAYRQGQLQKVGFRVRHLDPTEDVIFIVAKDGTIVTTWVNRKSDIHRTLDSSKYEKTWPAEVQ